MSGAVHVLGGQADRWEFFAQLDHPRFFHRILPWQEELVVVGGASMRTGKTNELERVPVRRVAAR
jgi:hypothetical protein